jgi:dTDP-4-amino-4,6-dideoxygalactose transaminase
VPASILRVGLKVRLCDVDPRSLSPDFASLERFDYDRIAAVVSANLYGIPNDLARLESFCRDRGVYFVDDAAQALGARLAGRAVGGFGAAGLFSFDKGKNITTIQGGAALIKDAAIRDRFEVRYANLKRPSILTTVSLLAKLGVYSLALRPELYEYVQRISALGLGRTAYDDAFPVERYSESLSGISLRLLRRLSAFAAARRANAQRLRQALNGLSGLRFVSEPADAESAYARFPIFVDDPAARTALLEALQRQGIGATSSYPNALCDVPEVAARLDPADRETAGARGVAQRVVTLPTHPYCPPDMSDRIGEIARSILGTAPPARNT